MKTVTDKKTPIRIVVETVRMDACVALDRVDIRHREKGRFGSIGSVQLDKVKTIPNGKVQIKYHSTWGRNAKVLKADLPADLMVERRREATEADGPDAGVPEVRTATHEGVRYRAVDPEADVDELIVAAIQAGMGEGRTATSTVDLMEAIVGRVRASTRDFSFMGGDGMHRAMALAELHGVDAATPSPAPGERSHYIQKINDDVSGHQRANARSLVQEVVAIAGAPRDGGPGLGKSLAIQHVAGLAAAGLTAAAHDGPEERDPNMRRMDDWLGAFEDSGVLRPGAKEKLMGSIWTEDELRDGRPKPGSIVIDG
jgi:hypothetical protein